MNSGIEDDVRVTEQAAQWFGALLDGDEKRTEFFAWMAESPRHVEEFLFVLTDAQDLATVNTERRARIEQLSREFGSAGVLGSNVVPVSQKALRSYEGEVGNEEKHARQEGGRRLGLRWAAGIAAAVLVSVGAVLWLTEIGTWETYSTKLGEQRALELPDGSLVHLNTDSKIVVRLTATSRTVRLIRGEALFTVEHDAKRPFLVHAADAVIQAIGTRFDVYRRPNSTRVAVIEGLVQVSGGSDALPAFPVQRVEPPAASSTDEPRPSTPAPVSARSDRAGASGAQLLAAGEAADVSINGKVSHRVAVDAVKAVAWRQRRLVFEQDTLGDIAAEFNRYNATLKIRVLGEAAVKEHFSGTFDADDPQAVMQALVGDSTLSVERIGNDIVIRERDDSARER